MIVKTSTNQSNAIINHLLWKRNAASTAGCKTHSIRRSIRISLYRKYWGSLICRSQYSTIRFASFHGNLINVAQASLSNENSTAPSSTFTNRPWFIALFDERGGLRISSGLVSCLFIRLGGKDTLRERGWRRRKWGQRKPKVTGMNVSFWDFLILSDSNKNFDIRSGLTTREKWQTGVTIVFF